MKKLFIFIIFFSVIVLNAFTQNDSLRRHYFPYNQGQKGDSIIIEQIPREKPDGFFNKFLFYLSPVKYDVVERVVPALQEEISDIEEDTSSYLLPKSNHVEQDLVNSNTLGYESEKDWNSVYKIEKTPVYGSNEKKLTKVIYGYHPYWMGTAYESYNFNLLSRIAYFSYSLNPENGDYLTIHNWNETPLTTLARTNGCKVDLCVTNFGIDNNTKFLTDTIAQNKLISNLIILLKGKGDGVNINFEAIPKKRKEDFSKFIEKLDKKLSQADTSYKITLTIPAIDWRNAYDVAVLKDFTDYFFLMGYDFFGKYSKIAGPNSLLFSGANWLENNINTTINFYLDNGVEPKQMLLGLPYYGNEWVTDDTNIPSTAVKFVKARSFSYINNNYSDKYLSHYDSASHSIYYIFRRDDKWVQVWTDNEQSLSIKFDYINEMKLGGLGIWALGYDNGYSEYWQLIDEKFNTKIEETPKYEANLDTLFDNSLIGKAINQIKKTDPDYKDRFEDNLSKSFRVFILIFSIILFFAIIGFVIAIVDFDVRFVLFNKEIRVYIFIGLLLLLILLLLRIFGFLNGDNIRMTLAILLGIFTAIVVLNVGKLKRKKKGEIKP